MRAHTQSCLFGVALLDRVHYGAVVLSVKVPMLGCESPALQAVPLIIRPDLCEKVYDHYEDDIVRRLGDCSMQSRIPLFEAFEF